MRNTAGYKSAAEVAGEAAVEIEEDAGGRGRGMARRAPIDGGDGHGGAQAFATDIADSDEDAALVVGADVIEVAANVGGRDVSALHEKAGDRRRGDDEALLDFAGGVEFNAEVVGVAHAVQARLPSMMNSARAESRKAKLKVSK